MKCLNIILRKYEIEVMGNVISIVYVKTNSMVDEKIAAGVLAITDSEVFFKVSKQKMKIASLLVGKDAASNATLNLKLIKGAVDQENKTNEGLNQDNPNALFTKKNLENLIKQSNGLISFGQPKPYAGLLGQTDFTDIFEEFLGLKSLK